jgi:hypothetical protein
MVKKERVVALLKEHEIVQKTLFQKLIVLV